MCNAVDFYVQISYNSARKETFTHNKFQELSFYYYYKNLSFKGEKKSL